MIDWTKSMTQTYEFYKVDPNTWKDTERIHTIESCTINRDESSETLGSASLNGSEALEEGYVRIYLSVNQNGEELKVPLATVMVQTPSTSFDGKRYSISMDAYTPLIEMKESYPSIGYSLLKGQKILEIASDICREKLRSPVIEAKSTDTLYADFVANIDDTWLSFVRDLVANAKRKLYLDPLGQLLFEIDSDVASLQPVWIFNDGNSSILLPTLKDNRDLYGIPNVVEVVYSSNETMLFSRIVNDDPNSPISTVNRGREIVYRESSPKVSGKPTQAYLDEYATQLLRNKSCLEHTITYSHGYCPVRVGDCVLLNYERANVKNVKAKVISQSIKCDTGCTVEETAVYTTRLWR